MTGAGGRARGVGNRRTIVDYREGIGGIVVSVGVIGRENA